MTMAATQPSHINFRRTGDLRSYLLIRRSVNDTSRGIAHARPTIRHKPPPRGLWQDDHLARHAYFVVIGAYVRISARRGEGHAKSRGARSQLSQSGALLRLRCNPSRIE